MSAAVALVLAAADVQPILTPVSYQVAVISRDDGSEVASLLAVSSSTLEAETLSDQQRLVWSDVKNRIATQYAGANRRGRGRLTLEVLKLEGASSVRHDHAVWFRFPGDATTHAERVSYPHEGMLWRVTDPASGQYVAIVKYEDTTALMQLIHVMFADKDHADVTAKIGTELQRVAEQSEALVEVNGQRQYVAKGTATPAALATEMVGLLPNLYGEGRARILQTIALIAALPSDAFKEARPPLDAMVMLCAAPCDAKALPLPAVPATLSVRTTANRNSCLEPVDEAVAEEFFRDGQWPEPDLDLPFAELVKKLLSAKD